MLATFFRRRRQTRAAIVALLGAAVCLTAVADGRAASTGTLHLRCTNDKSGAGWDIVVDLDRSRVDTQPATVTDAQITWPDPKQGTYELERATGKLVFRNASSTGGYFLYYTCRPE